MVKKILVLALLVSCYSSGQLLNAASTFYVDPINGSMAGDGSAANPWSTLQGILTGNLFESQKPAVLPYNGTLTAINPGAPIKAGDTLKLLNGHHGTFLPRGYFNQDTITIEAETGHSPTLERLNFKGGENWKLKGLTVSPELGSSTGGNIVHFETHNFWGPVSHMSIEDSTIYSTLDSSAWTASDWLSKAGNGIKATGSDFTFHNNKITNVNFGINTSGDDIVASSNAIENYSADGMRGGGDRVTFENNSIKWAYNVDANHDDAIQFFRAGGVAHNDVILRGNHIVSYADPARPLTHGAQGIGSFDGPYVNWLVENNVVMTAHHHGISVYEAEDSTIRNNTVLDITGAFNSWVNVTDSTNTTVTNNLASNYITTGATGLTSHHNITLNTTIQNNSFEDWQNGDLRLKAGATAIDAGDGTSAPAEDIEGRTRPIGDGVDIGAYEYTLGGDFDSDGDVGGGDFLLWQQGLGLLEGASPADGDANADDAVDAQDLVVWQNGYGNTAAGVTNSVPASASVPEPSSVVLALSSLAAFGFRKRSFR